jgi:hypothetical protein
MAVANGDRTMQTAAGADDRAATAAAGPSRGEVPTGGAVPAGSVRYRRLVVDQDGLHLAVDVHPTLTVVIAPGELVDRLAATLEGAVTGQEPGMHAELVDAEGRELVVFRPHGGRARVLDVARQAEVPPTDLSPLRSPAPGPGVPPGDTVRRLSAVDQTQLWGCAESLACAQEAKGGDSTAAPEVNGGSAPRRPRAGRLGFGRRPRRESAPTGGGATDVDGQLQRWRSLAGEVPVGEAVALRPVIEACAGARHRSSTPAAQSTAGDLPVPRAAVDRVATSVAGLLDRPSQAPQVMVLPPPGLEGADLRLLLALLPEAVAGRQVIVVSASDEVAGWGHAEADAEHATVVTAAR